MLIFLNVPGSYFSTAGCENLEGTGNGAVHAPADWHAGGGGGCSMMQLKRYVRSGYEGLFEKGSCLWRWLVLHFICLGRLVGGATSSLFGAAPKHSLSPFSLFEQSFPRGFSHGFSKHYFVKAGAVRYAMHIPREQLQRKGNLIHTSRAHDIGIACTSFLYL